MRARATFCLLLLVTAPSCRQLAEHSPAGLTSIDGSKPPGDGLPPPPPNDGSFEGPPPALFCKFESVGAGDDVVDVWASAKHGAFALTRGQLSQQQASGWVGAAIIGTVWPSQNARKMHGANKWLVVGGRIATGAGELALLDLESRTTKQTFRTSSTTGGAVADVRVIAAPTGKPDDDKVALVQADAVNLAFVKGTSFSLLKLVNRPANSILTTVGEFPRRNGLVFVAGYIDPPAAARGFIFKQKPLFTQYEMSSFSGIAPLAAWSDHETELLVGAPAVSGHVEPVFKTQHAIGRTPRDVWGRSQSEIYTVGDGGFLARFDGAGWKTLALAGSFDKDDYVAIWGVPEQAKLWIAVSGAAGVTGRGGVLTCDLP